MGLVVVEIGATTFQPCIAAIRLGARVFAVPSRELGEALYSLVPAGAEVLDSSLDHAGAVRQRLGKVHGCTVVGNGGNGSAARQEPFLSWVEAIDPSVAFTGAPATRLLARARIRLDARGYRTSVEPIDM